MEKSSPLSTLLKDYSIDFSKEELEKIISTELEKVEDERDPELIELCRVRIENTNKKSVAKKSFPVRLIILIITAVALVFAFVPSFLKIVKAESPAPTSQNISTETTVTTTTPPTDPVSAPTRAYTTCVPDVFINFLSMPEKIIFCSEGKTQTLTKEINKEVIEKINIYLREGYKGGGWKYAAEKNIIDEIKSNSYIEIYYDSVQTFSTAKSIGERKYNHLLISLDGQYKNIIFFGIDGKYMSLPIGPLYDDDFSVEILKDIFDEWVTRP